MDTSHVSLHTSNLATFLGEFFILCAASGLHSLSSVVFWALVVVASVKINANMRLVSRDGDCIDLVAYLVMRPKHKVGQSKKKTKEEGVTKLRSANRG